MLNIEIKTVPHDKEPYNTVGEYHYKEEKETIQVTDLGNWKYEALIAIHEVIESTLCRDRGITVDMIADFDKKFDATSRTEATPTEPGLDPACPYHKAHMIATDVEKMMAKELNVDWDEYNKAIDSTYSRAIRKRTFQADK